MGAEEAHSPLHHVPAADVERGELQSDGVDLELPAAEGRAEQGGVDDGEGAIGAGEEEVLGAEAAAGELGLAGEDLVAGGGGPGVAARSLARAEAPGAEKELGGVGDPRGPRALGREIAEQALNDDRVARGFEAA